MSERETAAAAGIGFPGMLAIVFITLKLLGKITWSWWWVLSPVWLPFTVVMGVVLVALVIAVFWPTRQKARR